jgi:hypothetical protein
MNRALASTVTAAVAATIVTCSPVASAKPVDPGNDGSLTPVGVVVDGGRTDQQFWGESTWLNPLSGLNLDRTAVATH